MRRDSILFRFTALAAGTALYASVLPSVARAQTAPFAADATAEAEINPPALVGALVQMSGTVSFHSAGADAWSPAVLNYPITNGEGLWTQPDARARISIGDSVLTMAGGTELEVSSLDAQGLIATVPQGETYVRVRSLYPGQSLSLVTPRGSVTIATPGRYGIFAGTTTDPTRIDVVEGAVTLGEGAEGQVGAGQAAVITGDQAPFQVQIVPAQPDAFLAEMLREEQPRPVAGVAAPPLVAEMPGGDELAEYGTWQQTPEYGPVWYPQVSADWVPYREGYWAYVAPWGWTWVDNDPWGFAPFHYGRWVELGGRWCWTPGVAVEAVGAPPYPVYAPALVSFIGIGIGVGITAALLSSARVGWVPLGPGEVWHPWFRAAPTYVRQVNIRQVTNINQINITNTTININQYRNVRAATVVPAAAMATSRPIRAVARPADPQELAQAHPLLGRQPVPPTTATFGVTPAVARQVHAVPPPAGVPTAARAPAPGPAIRAPSVRPAGAGAVPPVAAARPGVAASARPGVAASAPPTPALRAAGAVPPAHPITAAPFAAARPAPAPRPEAALRPTSPAPHAPTEAVAPHPAAPIRPAPVPEAAVARPAPQVHLAPAPHPAPEVHANAPAPRPAPELHAVAPAPHPTPEFHASPPPAYHPPAPAVHAAAPPRPALEAVHAAPPPRPAPAARPAPQREEKRPGQP
ncbi:MAG TPA: DUF6600 domain-containing protein [Acetobacteraceae bacterium]|nr:DUF6600 domain-containing protein [Acetobacteraceae bacterium]